MRRVEPLVTRKDHRVGRREGERLLHRVEVLEPSELEQGLVAHKLAELCEVDEANEAKGEVELLHRQDGALAPVAPSLERRRRRLQCAAVPLVLRSAAVPAEQQQHGAE